MKERKKRYFCDKITETLDKTSTGNIYLSWFILFILVCLISGFFFLKVCAISGIMLGICSVAAGIIITTTFFGIMLIALLISSKLKEKEHKN